MPVMFRGLMFVGLWLFCTMLVWAGNKPRSVRDAVGGARLGLLMTLGVVAVALIAFAFR